MGVRPHIATYNITSQPKKWVPQTGCQNARGHTKQCEVPFKNSGRNI
jgi:hypothetical protein